MSSSFSIGFAAPPEVGELVATIDHLADRRKLKLVRAEPLYASVIPPQPRRQNAIEMIQVQDFVATAARNLGRPVTVFARPLTVLRHEGNSFLVTELEGAGTQFAFSGLRASFDQQFGGSTATTEVRPRFSLLSTIHVCHSVFDALCEEVRHSPKFIESRLQLSLSQLALYERVSSDFVFTPSYECTLGERQAA